MTFAWFADRGGESAADHRAVDPQDKLAAEYEARDNRLDMEFGRQRGAPYAMVSRTPPHGAGSALHRARPGRPWWRWTSRPARRSGMLPLDLCSYRRPVAGRVVIEGGPMTTAGGLIFVRRDNHRDPATRFDVQNGKELWVAICRRRRKIDPMTYSIGGKQFVVICAGGHGKAGSKMAIRCGLRAAVTGM